MMTEAGILDLARRRALRTLAVAILFAALPATHALAEDGGNGGGNGNDKGSGDSGGDGGGGDGGDSGTGTSGGSLTASSNDHVLDAVQSGAVAPLKDILANVRKSYNGDVVRIKLTTQGRSPVYSIRMLGTDNRLRDILVDAKTGQILSTGIY